MLSDTCIYLEYRLTVFTIQESASSLFNCIDEHKLPVSLSLFLAALSIFQRRINLSLLPSNGSCRDSFLTRSAFVWAERGCEYPGRGASLRVAKNSLFLRRLPCVSRSSPSARYLLSFPLIAQLHFVTPRGHSHGYYSLHAQD